MEPVVDASSPDLLLDIKASTDAEMTLIRDSRDDLSEQVEDIEPINDHCASTKSSCSSTNSSKHCVGGESCVYCSSL